MAQGLLDAGVDPNLINVFLFAPHQPNQTPSVDINVYQFSRKSDKVSSKGILSKLFGGSKFAWIEGAEGTQSKDGNDDGLGNHSIQTYTAAEVQEQNPELYQWLIDQGIINENGNLNNNQ